MKTLEEIFAPMLKEDVTILYDEESGYITLRQDNKSLRLHAEGDDMTRLEWDYIDDKGHRTVG